MLDMFSIEQLDRRAMSAKAEIQHIRRKFFTLSMIASAFLVVSWRFMFEYKMPGTWFIVPLTLNGITWLLIVVLSLQRFIRMRIRFEHKESEFDHQGVIDEYRGYQFYLKRLYRYEAVFEVLISLQFFFLVICYFMTYYYRYRW